MSDMPVNDDQPTEPAEPVYEGNTENTPTPDYEPEHQTKRLRPDDPRLSRHLRGDTRPRHPHQAEIDALHGHVPTEEEIRANLGDAYSALGDHYLEQAGVKPYNSGDGNTRTEATFHQATKEGRLFTPDGTSDTAWALDGDLPLQPDGEFDLNHVSLAWSVIQSAQGKPAAEVTGKYAYNVDVAWDYLFGHTLELAKRLLEHE
jgi:hypothetical protein